MKLKGYFWILAVSGTGAAAALGVLALPEKPLLFWSAEAGALIILLLFIGLYRKLVRPYQLLFSGIDLLRQQDFASRLRPIRNREANQLIEVFNRMITQLKQERSEVREKNHFLDLLIQASPQGVIILDFDERISEINPAGLKLLKIEDFSQVKGLSLAEAPCELTRELAGLELYDETVIRTADRRVYRCIKSSFMDRGFVHPFLLVEELTREVMKLEKESYERIIRMIAHEVNNSVGAIGSTLCAVSDALRQEERPEWEEFRPAVTASYDRCNHMSQFINKLADMVRIPEPMLSDVRLNELLRSVEAIARIECQNRNIRLTLEAAPPETVIRVDGIQFEQVLLNIIKNSYEAIGNGGEIRIRISSEPVEIIVEDNGPGIPEETGRKLFSPFFTTKPGGQGIGLMFVREVLNNHGLTFRLASEQGWTSFVISFAEPDHRDTRQVARKKLPETSIATPKLSD